MSTLTRGTLEVITGCMFSGKTEELIRQVVRAGYARKRIMVFDHTLDDKRYQAGKLTSHSGLEVETYSLSDPGEILNLVSDVDTDVIAIDEGHFFPLKLVRVCRELASQGLRVIVAGLNQDFRGEPFESVASLLAYADRITLLSAICNLCGGEASRTQRIINGTPAPYDSPRILVGGEESYQARCPTCHEVPGKPETS